PRERLDRGEGTGLGRPWLVIVLNDDHNTFQGVAAALSAVISGLSYDGGMQLANRLHHSGQAVVWSGLRAQADLYWEQPGQGRTLPRLQARGDHLRPEHDDAQLRAHARARADSRGR